MKKLLTKGLVGVVGMTLIPTVISCSNNGAKRKTADNPSSSVNNGPATTVDNSGQTVGSPIATLAKKTERAQAFIAQNSSDLNPLTYDDLKQLVSEHTNVPWQRGIGRFALTEACSYLVNAATMLGFKPIVDIPYENANAVESTQDAVLKQERNTAYTAIKNMFDGLKEMSEADKKARLDDSYYHVFGYWVSEGGSVKDSFLENSGIDISSLGAPVIIPGHTANDSIDFTNSTINLGNGKTINVFANGSSAVSQVRIQQYMDGKNPGDVIVKLSIPEIDDADGAVISEAFTKTLKTTGMAATYPIEKPKDREHNLKVLQATILQLSVMFDRENTAKIDSLKSLAKSFSVDDNVIGALEYLGEKFETNDGYKFEQVADIYDKLNNGSHYFKAVETLFRGLVPPINTNHTMNVHADGGLPLNGIIYSPIDDIAMGLYRWATLSGNGAYVFADADKYIDKNGTTTDWRNIVYN